ncbi:unnamed protein product [Ectocarpus fasciculatus]
MRDAWGGLITDRIGICAAKKKILSSENGWFDARATSLSRRCLLSSYSSILSVALELYRRSHGRPPFLKGDHRPLPGHPCVSATTHGIICFGKKAVGMFDFR